MRPRGSRNQLSARPVLTGTLLLLVLVAIYLLLASEDQLPRAPLDPPRVVAVSPASASGPARAPATAVAAPGISIGEQILALRNAAAAGDAVAMRDLAELIRSCAFGAHHGADFTRYAELPSPHFGPAQLARYRAAAARMNAQCQHIPGDRHDLVMQFRALLKAAAEKGDLLARLRMRSGALGPKYADIPAEDVHALIDEALMSSDPRALYDVSFLFTTSTSGVADHAGIRTGPYDQEALTLLACERGMDCGVESQLADELCVMGMMCRDTLDAEIMAMATVHGKDRALLARVDWLRTLLEAAGSDR